jgi:hypothetical protein
MLVEVDRAPASTDAPKEAVRAIQERPINIPRQLNLNSIIRYRHQPNNRFLKWLRNASTHDGQATCLEELTASTRQGRNEVKTSVGRWSPSVIGYRSLTRVPVQERAVGGVAQLASTAVYPFHAILLGHRV